MRNIATVLTACFLLSMASAARAQSPATTREVVEVQVTNLDVIVTDAKGNRVRGLTPADFSVTENGALREVSNLSQATASAPGVPAATALRNRLVVWIDDASLIGADRKPLLAAMDSFLHSALDAGDEVSLVSWSGGMKVRLQGSRSWPEVQEALTKLAKEGGGASIRSAERRRLESQLNQLLSDDAAASTNGGEGSSFEQVVASARSYADSVAQETDYQIRGLMTLLSSMEKTAGRKVLLLAGSSLPAAPGSEIFGQLENAKNRLVTSSSASPRLKQSAARFSMNGESGSRSRLKPILALADLANAGNVIIYGVNPSTGQSASGTIDRSGPGEPSSDFDSLVSGANGYQLLAGQTGGAAFTGARAAQALEQISRDLESFYSLGFRSSAADGKRTLEVRMTDPALKVRYRRALVPRMATAGSGVSSPEAPGSFAESVTANHRTPPASNDLQITVTMGTPVSEGASRRVPLHVMIPVKGLTFKSNGDGSATASFKVWSSSGSAAGNTSIPAEQAKELRLPEAALPQLQEKSIDFAFEMMVGPPRDQISVGVQDVTSQRTGFAVVKPQ